MFRNFVLLHADAVDFATAGHTEYGLKLLGQILYGIKSGLHSSEGEPPVRTPGHVLEVFGQEWTASSALPEQTGGSVLVGPLAVRVRSGRFDELTPEEVSLFAAVTMFDMGCCYHRLSQERGMSIYQDRARNVYRLGLQTLSTLHVDETLQWTRLRLGACFSNNLAAIYADLFDYEDLRITVELTLVYIAESGCDDDEILANICEWDAFSSRHAPIA